MHRLCSDLARHAGAILVEWKAVTTEEPWLALLDPPGPDDLIEVVLRLLDAAVRQLVHAAIRHGRDRQEEGLPYTVLFAEHYLLREAIWRYLRRLGGAAETWSILGLDRAVTAMTRASLLSYHADQLEPARLPRALEQLVRETTEALNALPSGDGVS